MGVDKAGLPWRGTTLLGWVLRVLADAVDGPLVVVGAADRPHPLAEREHHAPELQHRLRAVADPVAGRGPLQGIATGLLAVADDEPAPTAFVASVDLPRLHTAFVRAVIAHRHGDTDVALPRLGGFRQPLAAAYRTSLGPQAGRLLEEGHLRPGDLFARCTVAELDAATLLADPALAAADPGLDAVRGVNTPEEFRAAGGDPDPA
jgi:molybdopterin-guanine dinucleotide biosynthesis protein A